MRLAAPLFAIAALILPAAPAFAGDTNAPPGNSGIGQYLEVVPSASGSKPTKGAKPQGSALSQSQRNQLAKSGAEGAALAAVVNQTSPPASGGGKGGGTAGSGLHATGSGSRSKAVRSASSESAP